LVGDGTISYVLLSFKDWADTLVSTGILPVVSAYMLKGPGVVVSEFNCTKMVANLY
jgi:hypothetical protein